MGLKLASVKINNVLGIENLELTPEGNIIQISGHNGSGKTSTIEAIKNAIGVGTYSTILRDGCDKGEVVLDLGDMLVRKVHKPNGETLTLKGKVVGTDKMSNISGPAGVLRSLVNPNSVDPVRLLTAKPKELLDAVLSALPMTVDVDRFTDLVGRHSIDVQQHALVTIAQGTKLLMEERKLLNRDAKTAKTTGEQLEATLPEEIPLTEELEAEIQENIQNSESIRSLARSTVREVKKPYLEKAQKLSVEKQKLMDQIIKLNQDLAIVEEKIKVNDQDAEFAAESAREAKLGEAQEYLDQNIELSRQLSQLNVYRTTQKQVAEWKDKESKATLESDKLTTQLKGLQEYKEELCDDLPVEGLAVQDGKLTMNGISFETLNTAARVKLVIELSKLTAGDLGVVVIDNAECMCTEVFNQFLQEASKTDLIWVVARVSDHDFKIS